MNMWLFFWSGKGGQGESLLFSVEICSRVPNQQIMLTCWTSQTKFGCMPQCHMHIPAYSWWLNLEMMLFVFQESSGEQALSASVELIFDNKDMRFPVRTQQLLFRSGFVRWRNFCLSVQCFSLWLMRSKHLEIIIQRDCSLECLANVPFEQFSELELNTDHDSVFREPTKQYKDDSCTDATKDTTEFRDTGGDLFIFFCRWRARWNFHYRKYKGRNHVGNLLNMLNIKTQKQFENQNQCKQAASL